MCATQQWPLGDNASDAIPNDAYTPGLHGQSEKLGCVFPHRLLPRYSAGKSQGLLNVREGFIQPSGSHLIKPRRVSCCWALLAPQ